jgi:hypothetical protein
MLKPSRFVFVCTAACLFLFSGCLKKSEKQRPYYYSEEELDSHKETGEKLVNISSTAEVRKFIAGQSFVSKTYRLDFNDSLDAVMSNNGKTLFQGPCKIGEFMINDERLLLVMDEFGKENRFTLAHNGMLTDKSTYALFKRVEEK